MLAFAFRTRQFDGVVQKPHETYVLVRTRIIPFVNPIPTQRFEMNRRLG
jgi:hypothetical protein